jgi:hypothetical protein
MPDDIDNPKPWDQQPGETSRWYARLEQYRLAGPGRSLLGLYQRARERKGAKGSDQKKPRSVPESWSKVAKAWRWKERCEAFDCHRQQIAREESDRQFAAELQRHRANAVAVARAQIGILVDALKTLGDRVSKLTGDEIEASQIPSFVRAVAALGAAALTAEAVGLGAVEVLKSIAPPDATHRPPPRPVPRTPPPPPKADPAVRVERDEPPATMGDCIDAMVNGQPVVAIHPDDSPTPAPSCRPAGTGSG